VNRPRYTVTDPALGAVYRGGGDRTRAQSPLAVRTLHSSIRDLLRRVCSAPESAPSKPENLGPLSPAPPVRGVA
jgi:hypothetical protein